MPAKHFLVKGCVQGVFYRASAQNKAQGLCLRGWVRNCAGGDVECVASGELDSLDNFEAWLAIGPEMAEVREIITTEIEEESFISFEIVS